LGFDITTLGFPQALADATQIKSFPAFNVAGLVSVGSTSSSGLTAGGPQQLWPARLHDLGEAAQ
jgi:hypothetical protein